MQKGDLNDNASELYTHSDAETSYKGEILPQAVDPQSGRSSWPPTETRPLDAAAPKDSHVPLVIPLSEADGPVRLFNPYPPHQHLFSVTDECARRLLHEGKVRLLRSSKRVRGICPLIHKREPVKVVIIRGACIGKPKLVGPSWVQAELASWAEVMVCRGACMGFRGCR